MKGYITNDGNCYGRGNWKYGGQTLINYVVERSYILILDTFDSYTIKGVHKLPGEKTSKYDTEFDYELGRW